MFVLNIKKCIVSACVFMVSADVSLVCALGNELPDEVASLMRRGEIDARNMPLKASDMAEINPTDLYINSDKLNTSALRILYLNKHRANLAAQHARLAPILVEVTLHQFDENIHVLDGHVVANLDNLLDIARSLGLGRSVPLNEAQGIVRDFNIVSEAHLNALCADFDARHVELFSRVATLAEDLYVKTESEIGINQFITITDNWTTQGGCFQGRRNRLFVALASMMANIGV